MFKKIADRYFAWERHLRDSFGDDISTPNGRFWAYVHFHLMDHAFFRVLWTNMREIAPDVYRSNQPSPRRIAKWKAKGIQTVVNLRGAPIQSHGVLEEEACHAAGIDMVCLKFGARHAPDKALLLELFEIFDDLKAPAVFHCKSGADRAGFVSALYLNMVAGHPMEEAAKQLSLRHLHVDFTPTGVLDYVLRVYMERNRRSPISFRDWVVSEYDAPTVHHGYQDRIMWSETVDKLQGLTPAV